MSLFGAICLQLSLGRAALFVMIQLVGSPQLETHGMEKEVLQDLLKRSSWHQSRRHSSWGWNCLQVCLCPLFFLLGPRFRSVFSLACECSQYLGPSPCAFCVIFCAVCFAMLPPPDDLARLAKQRLAFQGERSWRAGAIPGEKARNYGIYRCLRRATFRDNRPPEQNMNI